MKGRDKKNKKIFSSNFFSKNSDGQFYLAAAIIIIVIIFGFIAVSNYYKEEAYTEIYDLGEELQIESRNVLDYGTYNELNQTEMEILLEDFTQTYSSRLEDDVEIIFISGNQDNVTVYKYEQNEIGIFEEEEDEEEFVPEEPCGECKSGIKKLELKYIGKSKASVKVEDGNKKILFNGILEPNFHFSFNITTPLASGDREISFYSDSKKNKIMVNCADTTIGPGKIIGDFLVIYGNSVSGGNLCPETRGNITICHKPGPAQKNMTIPFSKTSKLSSLSGHLKHGDTIGGCTPGTGIEEIIKEKGIPLSKKKIIPQEEDVIQGENICVRVEENKYNFKLNKGQNFYFIIFKKIGDETYVITN